MTHVLVLMMFIWPPQFWSWGPWNSGAQPDVPAIEERDLSDCMNVCHIPSGCAQEQMESICRSHWTCADGSRILLTGQDGAKHCVKF